MDDFISIEILGTMTGCSVIISLLTQLFKNYLPNNKNNKNNIDPKWLALIFSVIIGVLRIIYIHQFDFAGITSGVLNIFVLLAEAIGVYEIADGTTGFLKQKPLKEDNIEKRRDMTDG